MRIRCRQKKEKEKAAKVAMAAENASLHAQLKEDRLEAFKVYAEEAGKVAEQNSKTVAGAVAGMHGDFSRKLKKAFQDTISSRFAPQKPCEPDADGAATFQQGEAIKTEVWLETETLDGQKAKEAKEKTLEMARRMKELEHELQVNESESLPSCMHTQAQLLKHLCWKLLREQNVAVAPASTASAAEKGLQIFAQGGQMAASISAPQVQHTLQLT